MTRPTLTSEPAEQAVLSAMLLDGAVIPDVRTVLTAESFDRPAYQVLFRAIGRLVDAGKAVDPLTLRETLTAHGELDRVGGLEEIAYLVDVVPSAANVRHHVGIVRELAERRALIRTCEQAIAQAQDRAIPLPTIAQETTQALLPTAAGLERGGFVALAELVRPVMADIEAAVNGTAPGIPWGYGAIDRLTGGIMPGEVVFVCSVPGGCKTALSLNILLSAAERGHGGAYVSAEMKDRALVKRLLSNRAQVAGFALRTGKIADLELARIGTTLGGFTHLPIWIDDTAEPDIGVIRARARALKAQHPALRWLMVDFIQLVVSAQDSDDGRARELSRIAYALKGLAKELDVAVLATVQVDAAGIEKRSDKRPQLGDMQWSQAMRQAGDFVALMYRPALYGDVLEDVLELDFRKARELEPFKVTLKWSGQYMRVENMGSVAA